MAKTKFPFNSGEAAGKISHVREAEDGSYANISIQIPTRENAQQKFITVYLKGEDRVKAFKEARDSQKKFSPNEQYVAFKGIGAFKQKNGNNNYSVVVTDKMEKQSENFQMPFDEISLEEFKKTYNEKNQNKTNRLRISGRIAQEPKVIETKKGKFAEFQFVHNFGENNNAQFATVRIPSSKLESFQSTGYDKGTAIHLDAGVSPRAYQDQNQNTRYTFNLIARDIQPNLSKYTSKALASKDLQQVKEESVAALKDVSQTSRKGDREEKASTFAEKMTPAKEEPKKSQGPSM